MASLLCALSVASASSLSTKRTPFFTNHGIHLAKARSCPTRSRSPRLPVLRASSEELPAELLEDSKFSPLNDDHPKFGPPAILLMGLSYSEIVKVQQLLQNIQGDFLKLIIYTDDMLKRTLWDAMNSSQPGPTKVKGAEGVPRMCFLSGLTGQEILMFVDAYLDAEMEPVVFAAMMPNNAQKPIEQLLEEILDDHNRLTQIDIGAKFDDRGEHLHTIMGEMRADFNEVSTMSSISHEVL